MNDAAARFSPFHSMPRLPVTTIGQALSNDAHELPLLWQGLLDGGMVVCLIQFFKGFLTNSIWRQ